MTGYVKCPSVSREIGTDLDGSARFHSKVKRRADGKESYEREEAVHDP